MLPTNKIQLHRVFNKLDKNGDGFVTIDELSWLLETIGVHAKREDIKLLVGNDNLDSIDFLFFYETLMNNKEIGFVCEDEDGEVILERDLKMAFRVFDTNCDGFITCEELQNALSKLGLWDEDCGRDCKEMIAAYDANSDGLLDFEEFKDMMLIPDQSS